MPLETLKPIGADKFLRRRELGVINFVGAGRVSVDGQAYVVDHLDAHYVARGALDVSFESVSASTPAKFYLLSAPAHATHATKKIARADAKKIPLGTRETANVRTIHQVIHPEIVTSCQLVMGYTVSNPAASGIRCPRICTTAARCIATSNSVRSATSGKYCSC